MFFLQHLCRIFEKYLANVMTIAKEITSRDAEVLNRMGLLFICTSKRCFRCYSVVMLFATSSITFYVDDWWCPSCCLKMFVPVFISQSLLFLCLFPLFLFEYFSKLFVARDGLQVATSWRVSIPKRFIPSNKLSLCCGKRQARLGVTVCNFFICICICTFETDLLLAPVITCLKGETRGNLPKSVIDWFDSFSTVRTILSQIYYHDQRKIDPKQKR